MVDYCAVILLDNERLITDYYYRDSKSAIKRRLLGIEEAYDEMTMNAIKQIVENSGRIYLYNSAIEVEPYKLGIQKFLDIKNGINKVIIMDTGAKMRLTGECDNIFYKSIIDKIFNGSDFNIPEDKITRSNILKYIMAGFCRMYSTLDLGESEEIHRIAVEEHSKIQDLLFDKYLCSEVVTTYTVK